MTSCVRCAIIPNVEDRTLQYIEHSQVKYQVLKICFYCLIDNTLYKEGQSASVKVTISIIDNINNTLYWTVQDTKNQA